MFIPYRLASLALAALAAGCTPLQLVNELAPSTTYTVARDIAYGSDIRQNLDVYTPTHAAAHAPVVVFFYGGNWNTGRRSDYLFVGEALAARGFVAVLADYRLYPQVKFPDFLDDAAAAVAWAHANAARYGGDPENLFVMGHSAGAYNAAMIAADARYLRRVGLEPRVLKGFIGLAGPYDFLPLRSALLRNVFGYPDTSPATQPINFVDEHTPPALLITGAADHTVDPGNSERLAARMRARGAHAHEVVHQRLNHITVLGALARPLRDLAPVLDEISAFISSSAQEAR